MEAVGVNVNAIFWDNLGFSNSSFKKLAGDNMNSRDNLGGGVSGIWTLSVISIQVFILLVLFINKSYGKNRIPLVIGRC